jgi:hypothetical protein
MNINMSSRCGDNGRSSTTLHDSKTEFVSTIRRGMDVLMKQYGYSRERASSVLLRELQRTSKGTTTGTTKRGIVMSARPTDNEVRERIKIYSMPVLVFTVFVNWILFLLLLLICVSRNYAILQRIRFFLICFLTNDRCSKR